MDQSVDDVVLRERVDQSGDDEQLRERVDKSGDYEQPLEKRDRSQRLYDDEHINTQLQHKYNADDIERLLRLLLDANSSVDRF